MTTEQTAPNHHAHYPGFAGLSGLAAATTMTLGRMSDARLVEKLSGLHAGDTVIDIGCGPGTAARHAAGLGATVIGVDPAAVMLRVARLLTTPAMTVRYLQGSAEHLPLPDGEATVVWAVASVHHWCDLDGGLQATRRVLKPEGRLVALERRTRPGAQGHASHGWTDEQAHAFADRCLQYGFAGARVDHHKVGRRATISVTATAA